MTACVVPYLVVNAIQNTWNHWEYSRLQGFHVVCKKSDIALEKPDFSPYTVQHCLIHINKNKQAWLQCSFSVKEIIMWFIKDSSTWHWQFERPSAMFHQRWRWAPRMKERLTCTTLSNMCASGKNEMDTSDGTGTKTLWRNMGLASNIKNLHSHRDFVKFMKPSHWHTVPQKS